MSENKTQCTDQPIEAFLDTVTPKGRQADARILDKVFRETTGWTPQVWTGGIVGYGQYTYTYKSGRTGTFLATGFAPRKAKMVVYIMPGYSDFQDILDQLGPYKIGKSCLYLGALSKVNLDQVSRLIEAGLTDLRSHWPVEPT